MLTRRIAMSIIALCTVDTLALHAQAQTAEPYGPGYTSVLDGARREGKVTIYSATDHAQARGLLERFRAMHPSIAVDFQEIGTSQIYNRVVSEAAAKQDVADLVWSPAMDQQIKLATSGLAAMYKSPEGSNIPSWAIFRDQVFATSIEPISIVYNKKLLPPEWIPKTYSDVVALLKRERDALRGKVAAGDAEKSGTAFMLHWADSRNRTDYWELMDAFGAAQGQMLTGSGSLREKIVSGENLLGIGALGSYALQWAKDNPTLGIAFLTDYTPAFARAVLINSAAPHPNAARLFLDFMLSRTGQEALADAGLPSVRQDTSRGLNVASLTSMVGGKLQPIALDESLLELGDPQKRVQFLQRWKRSLQR
jgi:iron(III) transport system substrate-binding protein